MKIIVSDTKKYYIIGKRDVRAWAPSAIDHAVIKTKSQKSEMLTATLVTT